MNDGAEMSKFTIFTKSSEPYLHLESDEDVDKQKHDHDALSTTDLLRTMTK